MMAVDKKKNKMKKKLVENDFANNAVKPSTIFPFYHILIQ